MSLLTPWGEDFDRQHPLPEYPRPQLARDSYLNLNGPWEHAIVPAPGAGFGEVPDDWDGEIVVPFSPESELSGVGRQLRPEEVLWYRRDLTLPDGFVRDRVLLHVGAADQTCWVFVDGRLVGEHEGGYLPFTIDVTDALGGRSTAELTVAVRDVSDTSWHARGKQKLDRGGIWYTAHSGIWQTVWVESVPEVHVGRLVLTPDLGGGAVEVTVDAPSGGAAPAEVDISADGVVVGHAIARPGEPVRVPLDVVREWSPEDPFLYDVRVRLGEDVVTSYVGLRSFGVGPDAHGVPRLLLNGRPYFHAGVLDQGYWPDGLCTPPSDAAMVNDIQTMKDLGFTMLRKHIKVEPLRWYHHCDRLGILVWQDMVNGGRTYNPAVVTVPAVAPVRLPDRWYRAFGRQDPDGRAAFRRETRETVELLRNVTSLAVWVPFNEGWGQFDAREVADEVAALDPTRTVDHASGWHDQGGGHLMSLHVYFRRFRMARRRRRDPRAVVLSEYGGYNLRVDGHTFGARDFGYKRFRSPADLARAFTRLHDEQIRPAVNQGLAATVYTQLSDVEDELNGLVTYDRRVEKIPADVVRAVNARLRSAGAVLPATPRQ
ncbi:glycoside hydrolase family 2 protein [Cellulomonas sp. P22]|uniref:glycoside hydrolase family 2 protein n=1 Tax=Cellulomonas sp. P22 TaxID=3373189 RepID=UPI00379814DA